MKFFAIALYANWLLWVAVLVYSIYWSCAAIWFGRWNAANGKIVTRKYNPEWYWFGIVLLLGIAATLLGISSLGVIYRQSIFEFLFRR
jgi:hypothetical protein